jgi:hypothetical protein
MEYTDNVFTGQDLGVDKVENLYVDEDTGDIMARDTTFLDNRNQYVDVECGVLVPPSSSSVGGSDSPSKDEMESISYYEMEEGGGDYFNDCNNNNNGGGGGGEGAAATATSQ